MACACPRYACVQGSCWTYTSLTFSQRSHYLSYSHLVPCFLEFGFMLHLATLTREHFNDCEVWLQNNTKFTALLRGLHARRVGYGSIFRTTLQLLFPHDATRRIQAEGNVGVLARFLYGEEAVAWVQRMKNFTYFTRRARREALHAPRKRESPEESQANPETCLEPRPDEKHARKRQRVRGEKVLSLH